MVGIAGMVDVAELFLLTLALSTRGEGILR
jgi:hypothetical protein